MCRDCPRSALIYFHYNQIGHKKADFPILTGGAVVGRAPITLRITVGCQGKVETTMVKSRALQLTIDEALAPPDVVIGM